MDLLLPLSHKYVFLVVKTGMQKQAFLRYLSGLSVGSSIICFYLLNNI